MSGFPRWIRRDSQADVNVRSVVALSKSLGLTTPVPSFPADLVDGGSSQGTASGSGARSPMPSISCSPSRGRASGLVFPEGSGLEITGHLSVSGQQTDALDGLYLRPSPPTKTSAGEGRGSLVPRRRMA